MGTFCLDTFSSFNVAVLGDLMLDRYIWGKATRISQEAPVPVVLVSRDNAVPGGAANVARNLLSLGARALPCGMIGPDQDGRDLCCLLASAGADISCVLTDPERPTTVKTRVLAGNQQVVRIDREQSGSLAADYRRQLLDQLQQRLAQGKIQALILEDYAKGLFDQPFMQEAANLAAAYAVPVSLDPHPSHLFTVKGLQFLTPNRQEAFGLAGIPYQSGIGDPCRDAPLLEVGRRILQIWQPAFLLITLGAEGMALFRPGESRPFHIPTVARQVFDVSGAGDTVMATMTLSLLAGAAPEESARIANAAAGVVVGLVGTAPIEREALRLALS